MKKALKTVLLICLSLLMVFPATAYGAEENLSEWEDMTISQEEFDSIIAPYVVDNSNARTSGLITMYAIGIQKSGSTLRIAGKTYGNADVVQCGFRIVKIEYRKNSSYDWEFYSGYSGLYNDAAAYILSKSITPPSGYQYRVSCTHFAKKSIFSTETIDNTSNIVTM